MPQRKFFEQYGFTLLLRLPLMKIPQRTEIIELDGISGYYGANT